MAWKELSPWLKGGITGAVVLFALALLFNILIGQAASAFVYAVFSAPIGFIIGAVIGLLFSGKYWLKIGSIGALCGLLIWFYDFDFLLNMGGPNTPISDSINRFVGFHNPFFPLFFLMISFFVMGAIIGFIFDKIKQKTNNLH